jgi:hypothetical protein
MRTLHRVLATVGAAVVIATGVATSAAAEEVSPTGRSTGSPTIAEYQGRTVDMSEAWDEGALVCSQRPSSGVFHCYDDAAGYRAAEGLDTPETDAGTLGLADCLPHRLCLWDNRQYAARMVAFSNHGRWHLEDLDPPFHDRANSVANKRKTVSVLIDSRSEPVSDRVYNLRAGGRVPDLGQLVYPGGGNWNNKIDTVVVN